jgi:hypothetical protein
MSTDNDGYWPNFPLAGPAESRGSRFSERQVSDQSRSIRPILNNNPQTGGRRLLKCFPNAVKRKKVTPLLGLVEFQVGISLYRYF